MHQITSTNQPYKNQRNFDNSATIGEYFDIPFPGEFELMKLKIAERYRIAKKIAEWNEILKPVYLGCSKS